jgi:hypothetical protein
MLLMKLFESGSRAGSSELGSVLVIVAVSMPVLLLFLGFVGDIGNWFVHKRHLQLQADAAAFAGGDLFSQCFGNAATGSAAITAEALKYSGDPGTAGAFNDQIGGTNKGSVTVRINSKTYEVGGPPADDTVEAPPCDAGMVDVKMTEANLPWIFGGSLVPAINARARVEMRQETTSAGSLPVAVPDVNPTVAQATFIDEATGSVLATTPLTKVGFSGGLSVWDNAVARGGVDSSPLDVPITAQRIGLRIALGGGSSTTCGDPLVECYDLADTTFHTGIDFIRGWSRLPAVAANGIPQARDVHPFSGTCSNGAFTTGGCTVGIEATVDYGVPDPTLPTIQGHVRARVNGVTHDLTYSAATGRWSTTAANYFTIPAGAGALDIELLWERNAGTVTGKGACNTRNNNPCKDTFGNVHRTFSAVETRSGPIKAVQILESGGATSTNSYERCSTALTTCTHTLIVQIGITGNLQNAADSTDPPVTLRVSGGGSENQSVDCDPNYSNIRDEIANGCRPQYTINTGTPCAAYNVLWTLAQPWNCVKVQTGGAVGQIPQGMKDRIMGGAPGCPAGSANHWSDYPNLTPGDPRIVPVFVTPFGSFSGSGNKTVPVTNFATLYVTGWFGDPCPGDDPVPDKGFIVGHFIVYVDALNSGGGSTTACDFDSFGRCVAVLTR